MNSPDFELREADASDSEGIFALYEGLFRNHIEEIWGWNDAWQRSNFVEEWAAARTLIVHRDGEVIGYLQTRPEPGFIYVLSLALAPVAQGKGIGTAIMAGLKTSAMERGEGVKLSVFRTNPRALDLYGRLGFQVTETTDAFSRMEWLPGEP